MFGRSKPYKVTKKQMDDFRRTIVCQIYQARAESKMCYLVKLNDFPYDTYKWRKVKTKHLTIRYEIRLEYDYKELHQLREQLIQEWYTLIERPEEQKSIKQIQHFHAVKIIS